MYRQSDIINLLRWPAVRFWNFLQLPMILNFTTYRGLSIYYLTQVDSAEMVYTWRQRWTRQFLAQSMTIASKPLNKILVAFTCTGCKFRAEFPNNSHSSVTFAIAGLSLLTKFPASGVGNICSYKQFKRERLLCS